MIGSIPVYLQSCPSYAKETLKEMIEECFISFGEVSVSSAKVFVKPNLLTSLGSPLACTNPDFILAFVEYLDDHNALVKIGDSPAFGTAKTVLTRLGLIDALRRRNIKIVEFTSTARTRLECGAEVGLASEPLESDLFVNLPRVKAHSQMYVTLATKNLFGIVRGMQKPMLHMQHGGKNGLFARIIVDLVKVLPPHLAFIDGIIAMHQTGPAQGVPLELGCFGCSADPVALDTSILRMLELPEERSPLWREARRSGFPGTLIENINYLQRAPEFFHGSGFIAPDELAPIRFNPLRFLRSTVKRLANDVSR